MRLLSSLSGPSGARRRHWLYGVTALLFLVLVAAGVMRAAVVGIAGHRALIVSMLSKKLGRPVQVGSIAPYWNGLHPGLALTGLRVVTATGPAPVSIERLRATVQWLPLLIGRLRPDTLAAVRPSLVVTRHADGTLEIAGYRIKPTGSNSSGLRTWLLGPSTLAVEHGHLLWQDEKRHKNIDIRNVNISAQNSTRHHIVSLGADLPPELCGHCSVFADVTGVPHTWSQMSGQLYWHLENLDTEKLPAFVRRSLPAGLRGQFTSSAWSRWVGGQPVFLSGTLAARNLRIAATRWMSPVRIDHLQFGLDVRHQSRTWLIQVSHAIIGLGGPPWEFRKLSGRLGPRAASLGVDRVSLDQVAWLLAHLRFNQKVFDAIRKIDPDGDLSRVRLEVRGPLPTVQGYELSAHAEHLTAAAYGPYPGFSGVDGDIQLSGHGGRFNVQSMHGVVFWPRHFASTIAVQAGSGLLSWREDGSGWQVHARHFVIHSPIGAATVDLGLALPRGAPAQAQLRLGLEDIDLQAMRPFYAAIPLPALRQWLTDAIQGGVLTQGDVRLSGDLALFPFASGGGRFTATGQVVNGRLRYLPHWAPITRLAATLAFREGGMKIQGQGRLGGLRADPVAVSVANFAVPAQDVVQVQGVLAGRVQDALRVLSGSGNPRAEHLVPAGLVAHGQGQLQLALQVPLNAVGHFGFSGAYRFKHARLASAARTLQARQLQGTIRFTDQGLAGGHAQGQFLGGPAQMQVHQSGPEQIVQARGTLSLRQARALNPLLARYTRGGPVPWHATIRLMPKRMPLLQASMLLDHVAIRLPAPLRKRAGSPAHLEVATVLARRHFSIVAAHLGDMLSSQFLLREQSGAWRVARGRVTLGGQAAPLPRRTSGVVLALVGHAVNLDHWLTVAHRASGAAGSGVAVRQVRVRVAHLVFLNRALGAVDARLLRRRQVWSGTVEGPDAAGTLTYAPDARPPQVHLDMRHLRIPPALPPMLPALHNRPVDPLTLPSLQIHAAQFIWGAHSLGTLDFSGVPEPGGWRIALAHLHTPRTDIQAHGVWRAQPEATQLALAVSSTDLGSTLAKLGVPNEVAGGHGSMTGSFEWPGAPSDFGVRRLVGRATLQAYDGRFTRLHQGAAKILGLLDLHAIARYLTLDFSPVFKRGFVFNAIDGKIQLNGGSAYTHGVTVNGASANLFIQGDTDLVRRLFHLRVVVSPQLQNTLTVAGASLFASPVAGAAVLVMQRVFKKEISQETRITYSITGPWAAPHVRQHGAH
ncbi:MAG TPA: YhdP family protein [Acidiferrobacteraceae bacterium]|nr:YhdP family protein [Acidiferrobacteraceae bacterium]